MDLNIQDIISCIDLTSLNDDDTPEKIKQLCKKAKTPLGNVAAVCVYPSFIEVAKKTLTDSEIKIATVANFPEGQHSCKTVVKDIQCAIAKGADEIDVVFPYNSFLQGDRQSALDLIIECKSVCNEKILKVILETGVFPSLEKIQEATLAVIQAGANFVKTSTGKIKFGADSKAVKAILLTIKTIFPKYSAGLKISGGVRTLEQAFMYTEITQSIMGKEWINLNHLRFGSSQLVDDILLRTHKEEER